MFVKIFSYMNLHIFSEFKLKFVIIHKKKKTIYKYTTVKKAVVYTTLII